ARCLHLSRCGKVPCEATEQLGEKEVKVLLLLDPANLSCSPACRERPRHLRRRLCKVFVNADIVGVSDFLYHLKDEFGGLCRHPGEVPGFWPVWKADAVSFTNGCRRAGK